MLNEAKTESLTFTLRANECRHQSVKFLGIHIDTELTWDAHGHKLAGKLSSAIFILRNLSGVVSRHVLRVAYCSLFQSHLLYGLIVWGHSAILSRIFGLQRRAMRVVAGLDYMSDCRQAFVDLKILTLPCLYILECIKYIALNNLCQGNTSEHGYDTRNATQIRQQWLRLSRSRNGQNYYGIKFFNSLGQKIKALPSRAMIAHVRDYLLTKAFYSFDEYCNSPPK